MDKVSIVIPFYNCPYVDRSIESALNQSYENIEVIVVNDGSSQFIEKIFPYMNEIKYVVKENGGTASALNKGIAEATGAYFNWLSSDDLYHPDKVKKQLQFMKNIHAKASYLPYLLINEKDCITSGTIGEAFPTRYLFLERLSRGGFINGCSVMLDMNVFEEIGLFNETLLYTQDYDFWIRLCLKHDFHYLNEPLTYYRIHDEMGSKKHVREQRKEIRDVRRKYYRIIREQLITMSSQMSSR